MTASDRFADSALDIESLAAARDDRENVAPDAPLPFQEVAELFAALDKAFRSQRLYQSNNPVYQGFIAAARTAFAALWDRVPSLTAGVEENEFRWYGRSFHGGGGRESLTFLFYKDGIRFITFLPGFEQEIEQFLDVVNRARTTDQRSEDDMVTLLWQAELDSFQYSYVDALAEGLSLPQATAASAPRIDISQISLSLAGQDPSEVPAPAVQAGQPSVAGLINRGDFEETLYFLEPRELQALRAEVELEWSRDLRTDVLSALFDRLEDGVPEWRVEVLRVLRQLLPVFLGGGELASATLILKELNGIVDRGVLPDELRAEAQALFGELSQPAVLKQLMRSLEDGSIDPEGAELGIFMKHLGPTAMPILLASIERTEVPALQQRLRTAIEQLAGAHRSALVRLLVEDGVEPDVVRGAARVAGQLGVTEAAASLASLLDRPDAVLRRVAVEALARVRSATAMEALQRVLTDEDRDVRVAAARGIATLRYQPARQRLTELLESRLVRDADLTEKIAFFEALGAVATPDSVALLDRLLNGRRLLGKESPEMRACAALALGRVGSPAARAALQRASGETQPMIRNAVQKALRQESAS